MKHFRGSELWEICLLFRSEVESYINPDTEPPALSFYALQFCLNQTKETLKFLLTDLGDTILCCFLSNLLADVGDFLFGSKVVLTRSIGLVAFFVLRNHSIASG